MPSAFATSERMALLLNGKIEVSGKVDELKEGHPLVKSFVTGEMAYGTTQQ